MDDDLIDGDRLSIGRKSLLPGEGFFYPDSLDEQRTEERARAALDGAGTAVVADPDADGLACVALLRAMAGRPTDDVDLDEHLPDVEDGEAGDDEQAPSAGDDGSAPAAPSDEEGEDEDEEPSIRADSEVALVPTGPADIDEGLALVAKHAAPGIDVYVCDLCPDEFEHVEAELAAVLEGAGDLRWFDHHQWDPDVAEAVRDAGVDLVVGESDEECTADVALRSLEFEFPAHLRDLAAVTRDHDLWIREDPRSEDLADYSYWIDAETYVETVRRHGANLPPGVEAYIAERRTEKEALIERAADRAEFRSVGPWTVAVAYGRCSQNEVAERCREQGADATVIVKPAGSASIRGSEGFERCHEVARQVQGGGHPRAAGCKPDIYDDMLDFAHHWTTRGAVTKQVILEAFWDLVPDED